MPMVFSKLTLWTESFCLSNYASWLSSSSSILETFTIPTFFLALQGLSSGLYLFGKTVNPNTKDELEARINTIKSQDIALITDEDKRYLRRTIESLYGSSAIGDNLKPPKLVLS
jgi:hypothetical protein